MRANVTTNSVHLGILKTILTRDREGLITGDDYDIFISALIFVFSAWKLFREKLIKEVHFLTLLRVRCVLGFLVIS